MTLWACAPGARSPSASCAPSPSRAPLTPSARAFHAERKRVSSSHHLEAACAALVAARIVRSRRQTVLKASAWESSSLEAGARLLQDAVEATSKGTTPSQFQSFAKSKNRQSYVSQQAAEQGDEDPLAVDEDGLPLVYSVERIAKFWDTKPGELAERWSRFLRISTPFVTRFFYSLLNNRLSDDEEDLARTAVNNLTELGPTFVKLGQVLSIRPDVLPPVTMKELARLQDNIKIFPNTEARMTIEKELGKPLEELFSSFSDEPVAAASLAQVYRATLRETGEEVAVKVQRPGALGTVSKDLYVLRKLADVVQPLIRRFSSDETDYIALTETFAEGLYTELDFRNEALNALRMQELLQKYTGSDIMDRFIIPKPLLNLTTRRVMLSRWINGVKLSSLPQEEIKDLIAVGQELFLTQLLEIGFFHGDPHPGNLLKVTEGPDAGKLCLLDFGLVAQIPQEDRDIIVSAVVHLGTQNWDSFISDFIRLGFLTEDVNRTDLIPVLQRILGPYLTGGGAAAFKRANFQALTQDILKINTQVKFSIPAYVSLLARSVATLEGVALQGNPGYQIVAEAYPFVVRKLLKNESRSSFSALRELLYDPATKRLKPQRLSTMLQASLGVVTDSNSGFIDFDTAPKDGAPLSEVAAFLLSEKAQNLRPLLNAELAYGLDLQLRSLARRLKTRLQDLTPRLPFFGRLPVPPPPPLLLPTTIDGSISGVKVVQLEQVMDVVFPELSDADNVDLETFLQAAQSTVLGDSDLPEPSPQVLVEVMRGLLPSLSSGNQSDVAAATAELANALSTLGDRRSREVLTTEVLRTVSLDIVQTWRARLETILI